MEDNTIFIYCLYEQKILLKLIETLVKQEINFVYDNKLKRIAFDKKDEFEVEQIIEKL